MSFSSIPTALRQLTSDRAEGKCEYYLIHQDFSIYRQEVDLIAVKHGGQTIAENLALSCLPCNRHKGSDLAAFVPVSGEIVPLFNPRAQVWSEHFRLENAQIVGITPTDRATTFLWRFNALQP
jgi:5-methylcytosine-specific restriction endonuclease McrA